MAPVLFLGQATFLAKLRRSAALQTGKETGPTAG